MGKPSNTNPMRPAIPPVRCFLRKLPRLCARVCVAVLLGSTIAAEAQSVATTLPLLFPWAIAFDAQGNLYFTETDNHVIREVTPAGTGLFACKRAITSAAIQP